MATISNWYNSQYGTWNRTRNLSMAPYLARTDTNASRTAAAMMRSNAGNGDAVVIDMGDIGNSDAAGKKKKVDTLFGPNIGVVASGPAWTETERDAQGAVDELTPDVVKGWIAKSKESSQPTTTLQALVNLKRPTLRLTPLTAEEGEGEHEHHEHGLEFEYDCDAPRCGIYVSVLLPHDHPDAPAAPTPAPASASPTPGFARVLVFEHVVDGGFGRHLTLEEGAMLELARYDRPPGSPSTPAVSTAPALAPRPADRKSRRFTNFHIRKRGPALAVVDAAPAATEASAPEVHVQDKDDTGVKVHIRLAALDAAGAPLPARNEQGTYLHVVRMLPPGASESERDAKPWVVKVVKREAAIGPHTFQLHEIYGLSAQSSVSTPDAAHTYPPTREEEPQSECLLCLSAPRAVVLLPCRHLVACRECALNMVEFGAGGAIVQPEAEAAGPGADGAGEGEGEGAGTGSVNVLVAHLVGAPSPAAGTTANVGPAAQAQAARRKRKAKGWFCPVCRQRASRSLLLFPLHKLTWVAIAAYTSLLRITTSPPSAPGKDVDNRASTSSDGADGGEGEGADTVPAAAPRGLAALRPAFLRGISRASAGDAERGEGAV
ncbi:hypothetical protein HWV62_12962 [Athelia sp. TMB]|nr:hypothetical protein HWV62_12962 [Athelia sp. TMB]